MSSRSAVLLCRVFVFEAWPAWPAWRDPRSGYWRFVATAAVVVVIVIVVVLGWSSVGCVGGALGYMLSRYVGTQGATNTCSGGRS